jgi:hypothetical protein
MAIDLIPKLEKNKPICFSNIDTIISNRKGFFKKLETCLPTEGLVDTFQGQSKQYSYIRVKDDWLISDIVDNNLVSQNACSGLYGFGSFEEMFKQANTLLKIEATANFTQLYKHYLKHKRDVYYVYSENALDTIVVGTPDEYVINIHKFK